jgi:hypothetical protein
MLALVSSRRFSTSWFAAMSISHGVSILAEAKLDGMLAPSASFNVPVALMMRGGPADKTSKTRRTI